MKLPTVAAALALAALSSASASAGQQRRTATIYIQPITPDSSTTPPPPPPPVPLATIEYDPTGKSSPSSTEEEEKEDAATEAAEIRILSYEAPELYGNDDDDDDDGGASLPGTTLVRVGVWDAGAARWASGTTVARAENFAKGYAPTLAVTITAPRSHGSKGSSNASGGGDIIGVAVRGVAVDAGYTRDFGPKAVLLRTEPGRQVDLNRPVVLGPEGRKVEAEPEKSFLQKYWWLIAVVVLLTMTGGGGDGK